MATRLKDKIMADIAKMVEELSTWTVMDIANLVKELETKWGVSAAAPVAAAAAAPAGAAAPAAEAKTAFDVILVSVPADKKIAAIKAVREVKAGLGLADAKALVEGAPKAVLEGANKADSDAAKKKLEDAGAKVEVKYEKTQTVTGRWAKARAPAGKTVKREISIRSFAIVIAGVNRLRNPGFPGGGRFVVSIKPGAGQSQPLTRG
jgi:large subunit ribosomal protein L7/L12